MLNSCSECGESPLWAPLIADPSARVHKCSSLVKQPGDVPPRFLSRELRLWWSPPRTMARASLWAKHQKICSEINVAGSGTRGGNWIMQHASSHLLAADLRRFDRSVRSDTEGKSSSRQLFFCCHRRCLQQESCRLNVSYLTRRVREFLKDTRTLAAPLAGLPAVIILFTQTAEMRVWKLFIQD